MTILPTSIGDLSFGIPFFSANSTRAGLNSSSFRIIKSIALSGKSSGSSILIIASIIASLPLNSSKSNFLLSAVRLSVSVRSTSLIFLSISGTTPSTSLSVTNEVLPASNLNFNSSSCLASSASCSFLISSAFTSFIACRCAALTFIPLPTPAGAAITAIAGVALRRAAILAANSSLVGSTFGLSSIEPANHFAII